MLLPSRSSSPQVQSTVVCHYSKKVGNVLVFYNPPKTSIIYHHKCLTFCSYSKNLFYQNWKCSCPPHHHTWYLLGSVYNSQHCTLQYLQMHQYQLHCHQDTAHLFTFRTRLKKIYFICNPAIHIMHSIIWHCSSFYDSLN